MKKFVLTVVIGGAMFFSVESATAQVTSEDQVEVVATEKQAHEEKDWKQVQEQELPAEVSQAIETDYAEATVSEAFVMEKDGEKKYKLVLLTEEGEKEVYTDAQGNWIDKEKKK
ncbi:hypothetical protein RM549_19145 [Salegentibacter sp. F188]|uniref:Beta-lactamase-inhibitor-like PepSY-like domain-containing protein n=1 Tax=Autumnicola patrickiae TaxID=3075591 RepID=A0ABU3E7E1_9FLAO|nr:hypothetical protein [Salegentibacter sp. F188]MDT0691910.1 hypothetical protein [Salegentibacter sp. F188]